MRFDPSTGELVSRSNDYCPNCDGELEDDNPYCDRCGEYVGLVVHDYSNFNQNTQSSMTNNDSNEGHSILSGRDKACCGMICLIVFLLWFMGMLSR